MLVKAGNDGTYCATWTPGSSGLYNIRITLDGYEVGKTIKFNIWTCVQHFEISRPMSDIENYVVIVFKIFHFCCNK